MDQKCLAARVGTPFGNAKSFDDLPVFIGKEGEGEVVFFLKLFLGCNRVGADADDFDSSFLELDKIIAQAACLGRASGGVRFWIKINKDESFFVKIGQRNSVAVLIQGVNRRSGSADFEWVSFGCCHG